MSVLLACTTFFRDISKIICISRTIVWKKNLKRHCLNTSRRWAIPVVHIRVHAKLKQLNDYTPLGTHCIQQYRIFKYCSKFWTTT
jgi:hypothetical protein